MSKFTVAFVPRRIGRRASGPPNRVTRFRRAYIVSQPAKALAKFHG
jgi:hypothetical protein